MARAAGQAHEAMPSKEEVEAMRKQAGELEAKLEKMMVEKVSPLLGVVPVSLSRACAARSVVGRTLRRTRFSRSWTQKSMPKR